MARIAGVNIPTNKRVEIALTYIFGIGRTTAREICAKSEIDPASKTDILSEGEVVRLREVNWLDLAPCGPTGRSVQIKLRSTQEPAPGRVVATEGATGGAIGGGTAEVRLDRPQYGVSPGQAAVFYDGSRVLGGGWISDAELAAGVAASSAG